MAHDHSHHHLHHDHSKSRGDKVKYYRQALLINSTVWVMQVLTLIYAGLSLTLKGDMIHGLADVLILVATHQIFSSELNSPGGDNANKKKWLVIVAIILLWVSAGDIFYEAIKRISSPVDFLGWPVAIVALLSAAGNYISHKIIGQVDKCEHDATHNVNVAHLLTDAVISLLVFISASGKILFDLPMIDTLFGIPVGIWMVILGKRILQGKTH